MKVRELIELLGQYDEDADVFIMSQESWPFENDISSIISREEIIERRRDKGDDPDYGAWLEESSEDKENSYAPIHDRWSASDYELPPSDVFIVEGSQLRYGDKYAW